MIDFSPDFIDDLLDRCYHSWPFFPLFLFRNYLVNCQISFFEGFLPFYFGLISTNFYQNHFKFLVNFGKKFDHYSIRKYQYSENPSTQDQVDYPLKLINFFQDQ